MPEWCEESGEWIETNPYPMWPDCLVCSWCDNNKIITREERIYWAGGNSGPYDITYGEYYFCPHFQKEVNIWHKCPVYQQKDCN